MISIVYGSYFLKAAKLLPTLEQTRLAKLLNLLSNNPFDSRLHSKKLSGSLAGLFSFRIGRDWRALYQFLDPHTIQLVNVGHRKDIYE